MRDLLSGILLHIILSAVTVLAGEYTFELPDNEKQCFHEVIDKGVKSTVEFQVRRLSQQPTNVLLCVQ